AQRGLEGAAAATLSESAPVPDPTSNTLSPSRISANFMNCGESSRLNRPMNRSYASAAEKKLACAVPAADAWMRTTANGKTINRRRTRITGTSIKLSGEDSTRASKPPIVQLSDPDGSIFELALASVSGVNDAVCKSTSSPAV